MKVGFVAPDDLSTLIFCAQFADEAARRQDFEMVTISPVGEFSDDVARMSPRHIPVSMYRYVHPGRDAAYVREMYRVFRREGFDAVVTFTTKPNIFATQAARAARVPFRVMAVRGLGRAFDAATAFRDRLVNFSVKRLYAAAARGTHLGWFTNVVDREYFVSRGLFAPERTLLTANAVNLGTWAPEHVDQAAVANLRRELSVAEGDVVVVMVARLVWSKGVREFADAARAVRARHPRTHFLLVAPPEGTSAGAIPEEWVRERERSGDFTWLGFRRDVRELYALADVAVLPSYYNEGGYPRALLEPMSLGKPVIGADTPLCRGPVLHETNGFLVPPRDAEALADRLMQLVADPALRARFGRASLDRIHREFDDRAVAQQVLARIEDGLRQHRYDVRTADSRIAM
jgi:glycosyltransferase involved in cell wall biosynthesis